MKVLFIASFLLTVVVVGYAYAEDAEQEEVKSHKRTKRIADDDEPSNDEDDTFRDISVLEKVVDKSTQDTKDGIAVGGMTGEEPWRRDEPHATVITVVKVVQENVSGDRGTSYSEDIDSNRESKQESEVITGHLDENQLEEEQPDEDTNDQMEDHIIKLPIMSENKMGGSSAVVDDEGIVEGSSEEKVILGGDDKVIIGDDPGDVLGDGDTDGDTPDPSEPSSEFVDLLDELKEGLKEIMGGEVDLTDGNEGIETDSVLSKLVQDEVFEEDGSKEEQSGKVDNDEIKSEPDDKDDDGDITFKPGDKDGDIEFPSEAEEKYEDDQSESQVEDDVDTDGELESKDNAHEEKDENDKNKSELDEEAYGDEVKSESDEKIILQPEETNVPEVEIETSDTVIKDEQSPVTTDQNEEQPSAFDAPTKEEQPPSSTEQTESLPTASQSDGEATDAVKQTDKSTNEGEATIEDGQVEYDEGIQLTKSGGKDLRKAHKLILIAAELGHKKAMSHITYPLLFGDAVGRNVTKAVSYFESLAEDGSPIGQQGLAFVYGAGIGVNSSQARSLVYVTFAALGQDVKAQMMLGYRYFAGVSMKQSCEPALIYYRKVAAVVAKEKEKTGYGGQMVQRVRLYDELEAGQTAGQIDDDLLQYYQFLADKGDMQAQLGLGQLYLQGGRGVDINYELAFKYFKIAADAGNNNGLAYVGKMYMEGLHVEQDSEKALECFQKAADEGNQIAQAGMGTLNLKGIGREKNYERALHWFSLAAEQHYADAELQLGNIYYEGLGVQRDYAQAVKYFTFASQSGNILAFYNLANMHASGHGVLRSCHTAVDLFKNVAERGKWSLIFMDAYESYKSGDVTTALFKYYLLAELGYEVAQSNVAYILDKGEVDIFDENQTFARALLHWTRAAVQGYTVARVKVGDYHFYGLGTKVDYETAALHYRLASDRQNNAQAMFNLGYMHEQGFGLKKDIHLAKRFYDQAWDASPDAQFPVYIALAKLTCIFTHDWILKNYRFWEYTDVSDWLSARFDALANSSWLEYVDARYLGPDWDIYVITLLAGVMAVLLLLRRTQRR